MARGLANSSGNWWHPLVPVSTTALIRAGSRCLRELPLVVTDFGSTEKLGLGPTKWHWSSTSYPNRAGDGGTWAVLASLSHVLLGWRPQRKSPDSMTRTSLEPSRTSPCFSVPPPPAAKLLSYPPSIFVLQGCCAASFIEWDCYNSWNGR